MEKSYTIGQLAKEASVPTSTVRYYERRNLLRTESRSKGNYRLYDEVTLERLHFIRSAQAAGFTLADIEALLQFRDSAGEPCAQVQQIIQTRLDHVHEELAHLTEVDGLLHAWLKICKEVCRTGNCDVLAGLASTKTINCKKL